MINGDTKAEGNFPTDFRWKRKPVQEEKCRLIWSWYGSPVLSNASMDEVSPLKTADIDFQRDALTNVAFTWINENRIFDATDDKESLGESQNSWSSLSLSVWDRRRRSLVLSFEVRSERENERVRKNEKMVSSWRFSLFFDILVRWLWDLILFSLSLSLDSQIVLDP